jgi:hypothetical protein
LEASRIDDEDVLDMADFLDAEEEAEGPTSTADLVKVRARACVCVSVSAAALRCPALTDHSSLSHSQKYNDSQRQAPLLLRPTDEANIYMFGPHRIQLIVRSGVLCVRVGGGYESIFSFAKAHAKQTTLRRSMDAADPTRRPKFVTSKEKKQK